MDELLFQKILLVEDTLINQEVAKLMLEDYCTTIDIAENGQEAIDKLQQTDYQLILMDCLMPVMDGYTATKTIRELSDPTKSKTPIIAVTASVTLECQKKCKESGMSDYLTKPFSQEKLEKMLRKWSPMHQSSAPVTPSPTNSTQSSASDDTSSSNAVDIAKFEQLQKILGQRFQQFIKNYIQESESKLDQLVTAGETCSTSDMERLVHSLKSGAANLGCKEMTEYAQHLEDKYRSGDANNASDEFDKINTMFEEVKQSLHELIDEK
ncbi:MAG: response regulator [Pseudomonadota bacterium]